MRQIFNTLADTTPKCEAQRISLEAAEKLSQKLSADITSATLDLDNNKKYINDLEKKIPPLDGYRKKEEEKTEKIKETIRDIDIQKSIARCKGSGKESLKCLSLNNEANIMYNNLTESFKKEESYNIQIDLINKEINKNKEKQALLENKQKLLNDIKELQDPVLILAKSSYKSCMVSLSFNLKSNLSCKEIKQKIKIVNQKIISINRKSLHLKYGANSLPILNINKKFSDIKIKISKEFIVKLDNLNPIIFISNPSFYAIYKKAKDDLASYQTEGKTIEAKIKKLKEKNIPDKKISLKDKFSKLIKKLKTC